jgi:dimethylhistidine N-methyltransferase
MPQVHDLAPETSRMREDVLEGLRQNPKCIPSHYLYDDRGARLFEQICELDEYYLTRTENAIMAEYADDIRRSIGPRAVLIEPGSGAGDKALVLLSRMHKPAAYVPIDVACEQLAQVAADVNETFPHIEVLPVCADFTQNHDLPLDGISGDRRIVFFPGSTIGNFAPRAACELLRQLAELAGPDGGILVGVDLKKDRKILEPAYDDARGVSADFAKNILVRLNRELDADFKLEQFGYEAPYHECHGRIEMALISRCPQVAHIDGVGVMFQTDERVRTEYSYKYDPEQFAALARQAGLVVVNVWTDPCRLFSLQYLAPRPTAGRTGKTIPQRPAW